MIVKDFVAAVDNKNSIIIKVFIFYFCVKLHQ